MEVFVFNLLDKIHFFTSVFYILMKQRMCVLCRIGMCGWFLWSVGRHLHLGFTRNVYGIQYVRAMYLLRWTLYTPICLNNSQDIGTIYYSTNQHAQINKKSRPYTLMYTQFVDYVTRRTSVPSVVQQLIRTDQYSLSRNKRHV